MILGYAFMGRSSFFNIGTFFAFMVVGIEFYSVFKYL